jgi:phosphoribosylamine--glycine ligase
VKVLVVGGGGREHALVWKLAQDSARPEVFCAPGNAGTAGCAANLPIQAEDIAALLAWAGKNRPDLTVVGPEAPLCAGITDAFEAEGFRVFGPSREASQMEGSKVFAKEVMEAAGVPTGRAARFTDAAEALSYVRATGAPMVVKAEGLAAGKGVTVCGTVADAERAIREALVEKAFGTAGERILIEEFLEGEEASILALVDGEHVALLASSQDHKRVFDGDAGPNTGGMGAYSPARVVTPALQATIEEEVFRRVLRELRKRGIVYRGVLYAGAMITAGGVKVLEFNCRFGDPETQAIIPRLSGDLIPALEACLEGTLSPRLIRWRPESCVCVVMASGGYPGAYRKGLPVEGLGDAAALKDTVVFHAGTRLENGRVLTSGGRVLGVTALGADLPSAVRRAYEAVGKITFDGAHCRRDIAHRALSKK